MVQGSCLCGEVLFEIDEAAIGLSVACYCENCRKVSGAPYGVYLQVRPAGFRWLAGEDHVATYESSPGNRRGFCRSCGSVAPSATPYGAVRVPGGSLDGDPNHPPDVVLFSAGEMAWCSLATPPADSFTDGGPPEFWRRTLTKLYGG
jgi:hypothetical protein